MLALSRPVHIKQTASAKYRSPHVCGDVISNHEIKNSAKGYSIVSNAAQSATYETDPLAKVFQRNLQREPFKHQYGWSIDNILQPYVFKAEVVDPVPQYSWKSNVFQVKVGLQKEHKFLPRGGVVPRVVDEGGDDGAPYIPPDLDNEGRAITHDTTGALLTTPNGGTSGGLGSRRAPPFREKDFNNQNTELKRIRQLLEGGSLNTASVVSTRRQSRHPDSFFTPPTSPDDENQPPRPAPSGPMSPGVGPSRSRMPGDYPTPPPSDNFVHGLTDTVSSDSSSRGYLSPKEAFDQTYPSSQSTPALPSPPLNRIPIYPLSEEDERLRRLKIRRGKQPSRSTPRERLPSVVSSTSSSSTLSSTLSSTPEQSREPSVTLPPGPGAVVHSKPQPTGSVQDLIDLAAEFDRAFPPSAIPTPLVNASQSVSGLAARINAISNPAVPTPTNSSTSQSSTSTVESFYNEPIIRDSIQRVYHNWFSQLPDHNLTEENLVRLITDDPKKMLEIVRQNPPPIRRFSDAQITEGNTFFDLIPIPIIRTNQSDYHHTELQQFIEQNPEFDLPNPEATMLYPEQRVLYIEYPTQDSSISYEVPYNRIGPNLVRNYSFPIRTSTPELTSPLAPHLPPNSLVTGNFLGNFGRVDTGDEGTLNLPPPSYSIGTVPPSNPPLILPPSYQRETRPRNIPRTTSSNTPPPNPPNYSPMDIDTFRRSKGYPSFNTVHIAIGGYALPWDSILEISGARGVARNALYPARTRNQRTIAINRRRRLETLPETHIGGYNFTQSRYSTRRSSSYNSRSTAENVQRYASATAAPLTRQELRRANTAAATAAARERRRIKRVGRAGAIYY